MKTLIPVTLTLLASIVPLGAQDMVRAAGMSLPDNTLPVGSLTVRIVEGSFNRDVIDTPVTLDIIDGPSRQAMTGGQGRAEFVRLPVGARVRASATVAGHRLDSETFAVPATGGIRVLLVVPDGSTPASTSPSGPVLPAMAPALSTSRVPDEPGAKAVRQLMIALTVGVVLVLGIQYARQRRR